ncbi:FAD-binding protein, partial [Streptomyces sp. SID8455]|nr:FAD-binding protein [Streptomyces sp. SID8455]
MNGMPAPPRGPAAGVRGSRDTMQSSTNRPTRRTLLKAAGATALTVPAAAALASPAAAATTPAPVGAAEETSYDVIVIGAGFAGITAARELRAKGKRVLVL